MSAYLPSKRLADLPPYIFSALAQRVQALTAAGHDVVRLDIGSPDGNPPPQVIEALSDYAHQDRIHGYAAYNGLPAFREAVARYYQRRFNVTVDPQTQVTLLLGSKEGLVNLCLGYLNDDDLALVPDIAYPAYERGAFLAGAKVAYVPLLAENDFLPDLGNIPDDIVRKARLMWINYPNNPTGVIADLAFYKRAVDFCRDNEILLVSDNPYFDLTFDGLTAGSVLEVPGASDVAVEFVSFSKTYNMGGWRLGAAVGNADVLKILQQFKSNVDSGHFSAVQQAGIVALEQTTDSWAAERNSIYQRRRDSIIEVLPEIGLVAHKPQASMYVWAKAEHMDGQTYAQKALEEAFVSLTPGNAFGPGGGQYVRFSLGTGDEQLNKALQRLREWYQSYGK